MVPKVYYNEFDPFAAAWLRELIKANLIPNGDVDERSISEVKATDIKDYTQCHFFAGIGGWALALNQAGWGNRPVWTGSCPCQPFSSAGKQKGIEDERHLWPVFFNLICECKPAIIFGEQVATAIRKNWLDIVFGDLEQENYACGAVVFGAHSVGGPHIRQRLYWLADSKYGRSLSYEQSKRDGQFIGRNSSNGITERMAYPSSTGLERTSRSGVSEQTSYQFNNRKNTWEERKTMRRSTDSRPASRECEKKIPEGKGFWKEWEWLSFRDSKRRPIESGSFPLVNGVPNRMGRLRGYGNALCVPSAQAFIKAYMDMDTLR